MEQILQMFEELKSRLKATATQQSITNLVEHVKRDKILWEADQHNLAILTKDFNHFTGEVREDKGLVNGSLQRIQKDLDQNVETVKQTAETLSLTCATMNEQTRRLDEHDTKLHDQQNTSFFGSKNNVEKLEEFKEKHDRLSLRVLEVEDWMRSQAPKNLTLGLTGVNANVGSSKYIMPNEHARVNPKVGAQKTP
ncbi:hypothetical protein ACLB2K_038340 [Fragaria x ananassa]